MARIFVYLLPPTLSGSHLIFLSQSTWDLSAIKRETASDPGRHVVIVKYPHIVFRWYHRQEQVVIFNILELNVQILHRIQFRLLHRHEFNALTNFCIGHFGAVRDLYHSDGTNSVNSFTSTISKDSTESLSSPVAPGRPSSQAVAMHSSQPDWIPSSTQPRSVSRMLSQMEDMASGVANTSTRPATVHTTATASFSSPIAPSRPSAHAAATFASHSNRIPSSSQTNWISNPTQPPSANRMLSQAGEAANAFPGTPLPRRDEVSRAALASQANTVFQSVEGVSKDWDGVMTEEMMLSLISDDSFMAEVAPLHFCCFLSLPIPYSCPCRSLFLPNGRLSKFRKCGIKWESTNVSSVETADVCFFVCFVIYLVHLRSILLKINFISALG
jgi:hypothetical protein